MDRSTRRRVLRLCGVSVMGGLAGCSGILDQGDDDNDGDDIQDTDGDGVIDSEDYAPRDASVQRAEQVEEKNSTPSETESATETPPEIKTQISFENASVGTKEPSDPWSVVADPYPNHNSVEITGQHATHGSQTLHMNADGDLENLLVGVTANLSDVVTVRCDIYIERANVSWGFMNFGSWDGDEVNRAIGFLGQTGGGASNDATGEFTDLDGDVSEWTGEHELVFNVQGDNEAYFDNLRFLDENRNRIPLTELDLSTI